MSKTLRDKTLALAGIFQAASLVNDLASSGQVDRHDFETCIRSLFVTDPDRTEDVFGQLEYLQTGLRVLTEQLGSEQTGRDINIARYVISLLHLQRKLAKNRTMLDRLSSGIDNARRQSEHFHITHENVIANLAELYRETISQLNPTIMVNGESQYLSNPATANRIRALLLAGIRAAVLWDQCGGSRWFILLNRGKLVAEAERIREQEIRQRMH